MLKGFFLALIALVTLVAGAFGQSRDGSYRLRSDDVLLVLVYGETPANVQIPVGPDGNISAPYVGTIRAAGKTTKELEEELTDLYRVKLKLRDPVVSVSVVLYRAIRAAVTGFVNRPGIVDGLKPGDTLLTLLAAGGGPVVDRSDMRHATLRRQNSPELIPIDLYALLRLGDTSQNYELQDGDELIVPEDVKNRILVLGAVNRAGTFPYKEPMTVMDAVAAAGGTIRYVSKLSDATIIREMDGAPGQFMRIRANMANFIAKGDSTQNIALEPGDLIYIPETATPDVQRIGTIASTFYFLDQFFRNQSFLRLLGG